MHIIQPYGSSRLHPRRDIVVSVQRFASPEWQMNPTERCPAQVPHSFSRCYLPQTLCSTVLPQNTALNKSTLPVSFLLFLIIFPASFSNKMQNSFSGISDKPKHDHLHIPAPIISVQLLWDCIYNRCWKQSQAHKPYCYNCYPIAILLFSTLNILRSCIC